ncbi:hypothetical protein IV203_016859 [Nitzschia inconspicua]|uniref:Uncharacterized protein n=1 Tax=Nitzschia inconspicua TaxID=303405 RepID=A0A9K3KQM3_9STRA|nr:hypothetical protein IV203_016859 [Nitzschia inconspicua]
MAFSLQRPLRAVILLLFLPSLCAGQFGVLNNNKKDQSGNPVRDDDLEAVSKEDMKRYMARAATLQAASPNIPSQDAVDLAALLDAVTRDPGTKAMVENLQGAKGRQETLEAFSDSLTQQQVVEALHQTMDELKALEYLFVDPEKAFIEMQKDGLVPEQKAKFYKENPRQLEEDMRQGLYFSFVSLAVADENHLVGTSCIRSTSYCELQTLHTSKWREGKSRLYII